MDERYSFFSKKTEHWGDVYISTASNSPLIVATFIYPRQPCDKDEGCEQVWEHFVGDTGEVAKAALVAYLDQKFGPHQYDLQRVMLD